MTRLATVWVFSDMADRYPELIAGAASLSESISAVVIGGADYADRAFAAGATKVYLVAPDSSLMVEDYVPTLEKLVGNSPAAVLISATKRGKVVAARLGSRLKAAVVTEITAVSGEAGGFEIGRMVYGGLAIGTEKVASPVVICTVGSGIFDPLTTGGNGETINVPVETPSAVRITCVERRARQGSSVDLAKAKRVVGVGRGLKAKEDLPMIYDLARALDAEVGCSRPIAEGENWLERDLYVGVTGVQIKADLYLALGISGQVQHLVGVNGVKTLVAVNKDKDALIFQNVDYGLVGDMYKVIPALIAAFR